MVREKRFSKPFTFGEAFGGAIAPSKRFFELSRGLRPQDFLT